MKLACASFVFFVSLLLSISLAQASISCIDCYKKCIDCYNNCASLNCINKSSTKTCDFKKLNTCLQDTCCRQNQACHDFQQETHICTST